jgi:hypothetical protein
MTKTLHGFFSEEQAKITGTNIYLTEDSREVEVTQVLPNPDPNKNFPDTEYVGRVIKWLREGQPGPDSDLDNYYRNND